MRREKIVMTWFTRKAISFSSAFLIAFSTFGNAFFISTAAEPAAIESTVLESTVLGSGEPGTDLGVNGEKALSTEDSSDKAIAGTSETDAAGESATGTDEAGKDSAGTDGPAAEDGGSDAAAGDDTGTDAAAGDVKGSDATAGDSAGTDAAGEAPSGKETAADDFIEDAAASDESGSNLDKDTKEASDKKEEKDGKKSKSGDEEIIDDKEKKSELFATGDLPAGTKIEDVTALTEEDEFVIVFDQSRALTIESSGKRLASAEVSVKEDGHLFCDDVDTLTARLKLAKAENTEGQYYISAVFKGYGTDSGDVTKYLTTTQTGNSLSFAEEKNEYSLWSIEPDQDGKFLLKSVNAVYHDSKTGIDKPQYVQIYNNTFTTFSYVSGTDKKDAFLLAAYTYPELGGGTDPTDHEEGSQAMELVDQDQVIVVIGQNALTDTPTGTRLSGAAVETSEDGKVTGTGNTVALTVEKGDDYVAFKYEQTPGSGSFKYLSAPSDGKQGLLFEDGLTDYGKWTLEPQGDGGYYIKNNTATYKKGDAVYPQYIEFYSSYFTIYSLGKGGAAFLIKFYYGKNEESGEETEYQYDESTTLSVAKWGGSAYYNEVQDSDKYIFGDLTDSNDMLDKNAKFTVSGASNQPWSEAVSPTTGSKSYYMGSTGVTKPSSHYMQFEYSSHGYGNMTMGFRMRASNTAAGEFRLQYSTDGKRFSNLTTGSYFYKYTQYPADGQVDEAGNPIEPYEVSGEGDIADGIAKTSLAPAQYITFSFDIPNRAANAEKLFIRFIPGQISAKGDKPPGSYGVVRIDSVDIKGNPIVDDSITGYVHAVPGSGIVQQGQEIVLYSDTSEAEVYYSVSGGEYQKYDADKKVTLDTLPVTVSAYAQKEGLSRSIILSYRYTQDQVAAVTAAPNGGAVLPNQKISLKCKTDGANIFYRFVPQEEEGKETDEHDDWMLYSSMIELTQLPCSIQVKATKSGYLESPVSTLHFSQRENEKYNLYFGQIHAHTNISDGAGSLEDAFTYASKVKNLDYIVITDHSNSIDNEKKSKIGENVDTSENDEWTYAHNLAKKFTTDDFTCAYGFEMTWANGLGHINTYNTPGFQSRTQAEFATYSTALKNYYAALRSVPDSISQFNHPGTMFGDFQDFSYYTPENDDRITMIEVGNGEGAIGSSGYFPSYEYYTRALDKGWHVAPTNNQDNHKGMWGDANTARTVMIADKNDEASLYDAMRNYRMYATEDNDLSVYYTFDGNLMGTILDSESVGEKAEIRAEIVDPTDAKIGRVEVIVNGGQSIASKDVATNVATDDETVSFIVPTGYSYYYLKITEADGDIAVTAPVWVGAVEACGINKTYTNKVLPVKGESLDINVELYNNESSSLKIDNIRVNLSDSDGNVTKVADLSEEGISFGNISPQGYATFTREYVYNLAGKVSYEVEVEATLNGQSRTFTDKLQITYAVPDMVTDVIIDGTHFNDYVTGYLDESLSSFIELCAKKSIRAEVVQDKITSDMLDKCALLILSAPAKKDGEAKAGNSKVSHYSDDFINLVKDYVAGGGSVIVCGIADFYDTTACQTATEQNKLLEAVGATLRMGSDEVCDDANNGGQVYSLYPVTYNMESGVFAGLKDDQEYCQYRGCSVDISKAAENESVYEAQWLVRGFDTTYSVDCKDAGGNQQPGVLDNGVKGIKNDNQGDVTFLAVQQTKAGGNIYVAGGVFVSDYDLDAEIDNIDSLPYTNETVINNILDGVTVELPTQSIAEARKGAMNDVFAVEGYVTSGTDDENTTFFDTIYIQDDTAGIAIFPYSEPGLAIGTKVRIVGYVSQYQGDKELKIISSEILDDAPHVYKPKAVDTETATDYDRLGGSLLKITGTVTRVAYDSTGKTVQEFWLKDKSGKEAAVFIDGYINSKKTGKNTLSKIVRKGAKITATGIMYMHPENDSEVSVPVLRVRNLDEITINKPAEDPAKDESSGSDEASDSGDNGGNSQDSGNSQSGGSSQSSGSSKSSAGNGSGQSTGTSGTKAAGTTASDSGSVNNHNNGSVSKGATGKSSGSSVPSKGSENEKSAAGSSLASGEGSQEADVKLSDGNEDSATGAALGQVSGNSSGDIHEAFDGTKDDELRIQGEDEPDDSNSQENGAFGILMNPWLYILLLLLLIIIAYAIYRYQKSRENNQ